MSTAEEPPLKRHESYDELEEAIKIGEHRERERIVRNIQERISDLRSCSKSDNCHEVARLIESYISDWTERDQKEIFKDARDGGFPPRRFRDRVNGE